MRCLYAALIALVAACSAVPSVALEMPPSDEKIILTTASGEERVVSRAELDAMQERQRELHSQVLEKTETDWVEDQDMADVERSHPRLARSIRVAREGFAVLQAHGYARGYALASFTELDAVTITSKKVQQEPGFNGKIELRISMQLRAQLDPSSGVKPNAGTSAAKREQEPQALGYKLEVLYDKNDVASVVYAWQVGSDGRRRKELTIKPSEALVKRYAERRQQQANESFAAPYATWILAGGVALIVAGASMVFLTPRPQPEAPPPVAPVTSPKHAKTSTGKQRKDAKSVVEKEAGEGWELANGQ